MISSLLAITAGILVIGIANDQATFPQILSVLVVATILFALSALIGHFEYAKQIAWYYMDFVNPNGKHKRVRAHTYAGKRKAIHDYANLGYTLYADGVVTKKEATKNKKN